MEADFGRARLMGLHLGHKAMRTTIDSMVLWKRLGSCDSHILPGEKNLLCGHLLLFVFLYPAVNFLFCVCVPLTRLSACDAVLPWEPGVYMQQSLSSCLWEALSSMAACIITPQMQTESEMPA